MEIVAEYQGIDADLAIWRYFRRHWLALFPHLKSRSTFVRQAANLWQYKDILQQRLATPLGAFTDEIHLIDWDSDSIVLLEPGVAVSQFPRRCCLGLLCGEKANLLWLSSSLALSLPLV